jgi:DNA-binding transcriptional MerR regulator
MDEPPGALTIEQLSSASGLPFTTIRMYQHRGLLTPPERRGRVGYYGPDHRARLKLIAELQDKGYSLAAIKDLVDTWQSGHTLTDVLGVERTAAGVLSNDDEIRLRPEELAARFPTSALSPDDMTRAGDLGIIAFDNDIIVIKSPVFLEVGAELVAMGVPVDEVLDEYEHLRRVTDQLAERFASVFERNLWQPFLDAGMPRDQLPRLNDGLTRLGPLAERIVDATLRQALAVVAARFLDQQAKALAESPPKRKTARKRTKP